MAGFGFSIGDFFAVGQFAWTVYKSCKGAGSAFEEVAHEVIALHTVIKELEDEINNSDSILNRSHEKKTEELGLLVRSCSSALAQLNKLLIKYKSLGTATKRKWDRLRFGMENMQEVREKIMMHTSSLTLFLTTLGTGSLSRIEKKLDELMADVRAGRREDTVLTMADDDEEESETQWNLFKEELVEDGFTKPEIEGHKHWVKAKLLELIENEELCELPLADKRKSREPMGPKTSTTLELKTQSSSLSGSPPKKTSGLQPAVENVEDDEDEPPGLSQSFEKTSANITSPGTPWDGIESSEAEVSDASEYSDDTCLPTDSFSQVDINTATSRPNPTIFPSVRSGNVDNIERALPIQNILSTKQRLPNRALNKRNEDRTYNSTSDHQSSRHSDKRVSAYKKRETPNHSPLPFRQREREPIIENERKRKPSTSKGRERESITASERKRTRERELGEQLSQAKQERQRPAAADPLSLIYEESARQELSSTEESEYMDVRRRQPRRKPNKDYWNGERSEFLHAQGNAGKNVFKSAFASLKNVRNLKNLKATVIEYPVELTLEELFSGCQKKVTIKRRELSEVTGREENEDKILEFDVSPGLKKGSKINSHGVGDQEAGGQQDFHLIVEEKPHSVYSRDGDDLHQTLQLDLVESLCGWKRTILSIDRKRLNIEDNEPTQPGSTYRCLNFGMPNPKSGKRGDLIVHFNVKYPSTLLIRQKQILKDILTGSETSRHRTYTDDGSDTGEEELPEDGRVQCAQQ